MFISTRCSPHVGPSTWLTTGRGSPETFVASTYSQLAPLALSQWLV